MCILLTLIRRFFFITDVVCTSALTTLSPTGRSNKSKGEKERDEFKITESDVEFDFRTTKETEDALDKRTYGRTSAKYRLARCRGSGRSGRKI
mgnify:CR=1 FL=1